MLTCMPFIVECAIGASPKTARTNAPRPCAGRCVLMTLPGFTNGASIEKVLPREVGDSKWSGL